jgi:hypothetical protein
MVELLGGRCGVPSGEVENHHGDHYRKMVIKMVENGVYSKWLEMVKQRFQIVLNHCFENLT